MDLHTLQINLRRMGNVRDDNNPAMLPSYKRNTISAVNDFRDSCRRRFGMRLVRE